jgi:hypothetical protein
VSWDMVVLSEQPVKNIPIPNITIILFISFIFCTQRRT